MRLYFKDISFGNNDTSLFNHTMTCFLKACTDGVGPIDGPVRKIFVAYITNNIIYLATAITILHRKSLWKKMTQIWTGKLKR